MGGALIYSFSSCFAVPDFAVNVLSTNGSQGPPGPGLLKVSGLERSQERSQESCRDPQPSENSPTSPSLPPQTLPLPQPQTLSPLRTHANSSIQVPVSTHPLPHSEAPPRPQTPAALPLPQGQVPSPTPLPRPQPDQPIHSRPQPAQSLHPHPPSPALPNHHPHQQHPTQAGPHRPPSRCQPRPLSAYNGLHLNGHR